MSVFSDARSAFHAQLLGSILHVRRGGVPSNADKDSRASVEIAQAIVAKIGVAARRNRKAAQTSGVKFEAACADFLAATFSRLDRLRPGSWLIGTPSQLFQERAQKTISGYDQFTHLADLEALAATSTSLAAAIGSDYLIKPDIVIAREPESDARINADQALIDAEIALRTPLRAANSKLPILHASISCKWTLRSDRAQNARSEGLNLIKNRKGRVPHIAVITAEPTPARIASIALGTGEIDCVYHFALPELQAAVTELGHSDALSMLQIMVDGRRLRDIADLPLDLAV
jgi:hypothetical protein